MAFRKEESGKDAVICQAELVHKLRCMRHLKLPTLVCVADDDDDDERRLEDERIWVDSYTNHQSHAVVIQGHLNA
jgi:hypothetical protein